MKNENEFIISKHINIKEIVAVCPMITEYTLVGVGNHMGTLNSGHYYANVYNIESKKWWVMNDSNAHEIAGFGEKSNTAITLLYLRNDLLDPENFATDQQFSNLSLLKRIQVQHRK